MLIFIIFFAVPVTTYVFGPTNSDHVPLYCEEGAEIAPNIIYMGTHCYIQFYDIFS